jgi:HD-GYP domain-containing protein (c-di-GMP phosphodiesterase class II)
MGKASDDWRAGPSRPERSYLHPADFLSGRTDEVLAVLGDADTQTRQAALLTLIASLRSLQSTSPDDSTADVAEHYGRLFRDFPGSERRALRIEGLLGVARILFACRSAARAAHFARPALEWARTLGLPDLHRQAANDNGVYCLKQRDFAGALALLEEAHEVARAHRLEDGRLRALANMATCLQDAGYYGRAIEVNRWILGHGTAAANPAARSREANALGNLVQCHLARGELQQALAAAERGAELFRSQGALADVLARHQFESFFNAALLEAGRTDEARQRLRQLRDEKLPATPHTEVLSSLAQGLCETFCGQADIGISRLERLLPRAQAVGLYVDDVLRALIRAHEKSGSLRRALEYVDELTLYFGAMRTRQLHQQLAQIQQEALGELDPASHAEVLLGDQAANLRVKSFNQAVAERERSLLENWAVAVSLIDDETGRHCFRVGRFAYLMAVRLGLGERRAQAIEMAGRLHDIGKIGINQQILMKPSMLTEAERIIIRRHPGIGADMLARSIHPDAQLAAIVAGSHHEWWDGTGYPKGIRGDDIPVEARIVALADVYDVLTTGRPYKQAWPHRMAVDELRFMGGRQFDPRLVDDFVAMVAEYVAAHGEGGDDAYRAAIEDSAILKRQGNLRRLLAEAG